MACDFIVILIVFLSRRFSHNKQHLHDDFSNMIPPTAVTSVVQTRMGSSPLDCSNARDDSRRSHLSTLSEYHQRKLGECLF